MTEPVPLYIPTWVPAHLAPLIVEQYSKIAHYPSDRYAAYQSGYIRLATDDRMKTVWREIYRRKERGTQFSHSADKQRVVTMAQQMRLHDISSAEEEFIQIQDQAAAIVFFKVVGNLAWDHQLSVGPRVITVGEIEKRAATLNALAEQHQQDAVVYESLGKIGASRILRSLAEKIYTDAKKEKKYIDDPWIVERKSDRVGNEWERGTVIEVGQLCLTLFNKKMLRTVTILSNIILNRNDISPDAVQGILKNLY